MASPSGTFTDSNGDDVAVDLYLNRIFPDITADLTVSFAAAIPESNSVFHFEIAQVTYDAAVATVSAQTLHYNPILWSISEPP